MAEKTTYPASRQAGGEVVVWRDMNSKARPRLTVGELIDHLAVFRRDAEVIFGGSPGALTFNRTKRRGEGLVQIEFEQQVYHTDDGNLVVDDIRAET